MKVTYEPSQIKQLMTDHAGDLKLNVGCGTDYKPGWINIDNNSDDNIEQLDLNWDLRNPLPFPDGSVDYIFNEHFIEHLTVEEGQKSVKDFMRVLKPGGVMRIATPDLRDAVELYLDPKWRDRPLITKFGLQFIQTPAELMNMSFSWWGHKWIYDYEELVRRLNEAGFTNIAKQKLRKSQHKDLRDLEIRDESTLIVEIKK
jgi:predicted SAM-dependent methyltransferase